MARVGLSQTLLERGQVLVRSRPTRNQPRTYFRDPNVQRSETSSPSPAATESSYSSFKPDTSLSSAELAAVAIVNGGPCTVTEKIFDWKIYSRSPIFCYHQVGRFGGYESRLSPTELEHARRADGVALEHARILRDFYMRQVQELKVRLGESQQAFVLRGEPCEKQAPAPETSVSAPISSEFNKNRLGENWLLEPILLFGSSQEQRFRSNSARHLSAFVGSKVARRIT